MTIVPPRGTFRCLLGALLLALDLPATARCEDSRAPKVTIEFQVIEVATDKLRNLGFDWNQFTTQGALNLTVDQVLGEAQRSNPACPDQLLGFLKALQQNGLAKTISEPTLTTLSGRAASLAIGEIVQFDAKPVVIDEQHVRLDFRLEIPVSKNEQQLASVDREAVAGFTPLRVSSTVLVETGKTCMISRTPTEGQKGVDGKRRQTETLVLVRTGIAKALEQPK